MYKTMVYITHFDTLSFTSQTVTGTASVNAITVSGSAYVVGEAHFDSGLTVAGSFATSDITASTLDIGDVVIQAGTASATIVHASLLSGYDATITNDLTVSTGDLFVTTGGITVAATSSLSGVIALNASVSNNLTVSNDFLVAGTASFGSIKTGSLIATNLDVTDLDVTNDINVTNDVVISNGLRASGTASLGTLNVATDGYVDGTLQVNGSFEAQNLIVGTLVYPRSLGTESHVVAHDATGQLESIDLNRVYTQESVKTASSTGGLGTSSFLIETYMGMLHPVSTVNGAAAVTLPNITTGSDRYRYTIYDCAGNAGTNSITVYTSSGYNLIAGSSFFTIQDDYNSITVVSDALNGTGSGHWILV